MNDDLKSKKTLEEGDGVSEDLVFDEEESGDVRSRLGKLRAERDLYRKEKQEYLDGWQRARADLQNIKKQFDTDRKGVVAFAEENLIIELLTVLDSFDMAFANKEAWEKADANWRIGIEGIYKQFLSVLMGHGAVQYDPLGLPFDLHEHTPLESVTTENKDEEGKVVKVLRKGYRLNGKVIRPAEVIVAHVARA